MCSKGQTRVVYIHPHEKPIILGWLKPKQGRQYAGGVDIRTWRKWKQEGLRTVRVGGLELCKAQWIDEFLLNHENNLEGEVRQFLKKKTGKE